MRLHLFDHRLRRDLRGHAAAAGRRRVTDMAAKALFDELIRRRELVTTIDSGDLKGAWAENRVDVAIPQAGFTLQSVFRYLR